MKKLPEVKALGTKTFQRKKHPARRHSRGKIAWHEDIHKCLMPGDPSHFSINFEVKESQDLKLVLTEDSMIKAPGCRKLHDAGYLRKLSGHFHPFPDLGLCIRDEVCQCLQLNVFFVAGKDVLCVSTV